MFAVVRTGGKQYRVTAGDKIVVEKLSGNAGDKVDITDILLAGEGSDLKSNVNDIKAVRKVDDFTVEIETKAPFPILPNQLTTTYILSKKWCEQNQATRPDIATLIENNYFDVAKAQQIAAAKVAGMRRLRFMVRFRLGGVRL